MNTFREWLSTLGTLGGPALVLWQLVKAQRAIVAASAKAELAASEAAIHAKAAADIAAGSAANIAELTVNTNSIKDALVATTGELGRLAGREEMRVEQAGKDST